MWKIEFESKIFDEVLPDWEAFIFSDEIYWPIQIRGKNVPHIYRNIRLSPGRLLIAEKLISGNSVDDELLNISIQENLDKFSELRYRWKSNWEKKVLAELPMRIRQWKRLVQEIQQDKDYSNHQLANDIQVRLMIDLLVDQIESKNLVELGQLLAISDLKFKSYTFEDLFIWDYDLQTIFENGKHWYLYRNTTNPGGLT
jgi:hypothetical protein